MFKFKFPKYLIAVLVLFAVGAVVVNVAQAAPVIGTKKVAVIMFNFQNDTSQPSDQATLRKTLFTDNDSVANYFREVSFGQLNLIGDVFGTYLIDYNNTNCVSSFQSWAENAKSKAQAVGINLLNYDKLVFVFPEIVNGCSSNVGWEDMAGTVWMNGSAGSSSFVHELGHAFGLGHAGSLSCVGSNGQKVAISGSCDNYEYGDPYDVMALGMRQFNNFHKAQLGWLSSANQLTVNQSGTYQLAPAEQSNSVTLIRVPRLKLSGGEVYEYLYLEYRRPYGVFDDFGIAESVVNGVSIRTGPDYDSKIPTGLIDTTPLSTFRPTVSSQTFSDAALLPNNTDGFFDPITGISIETLSVIPTSATIQITYPGVSLDNPIGGEVYQAYAKDNLYPIPFKVSWNIPDTEKLVRADFHLRLPNQDPLLPDVGTRSIKITEENRRNKSFEITNPFSPGTYTLYVRLTTDLGKPYTASLKPGLADDKSGPFSYFTILANPNYKPTSPNNPSSPTNPLGLKPNPAPNPRRSNAPTTPVDLTKPSDRSYLRDLICQRIPNIWGCPEGPTTPPASTRPADYTRSATSSTPTTPITPVKCLGRENCSNTYDKGTGLYILTVCGEADGAEQLCNRLRQEECGGLQYFCKASGQPWITLSAGSDSRLDPKITDTDIVKSINRAPITQSTPTQTTVIQPPPVVTPPPAAQLTAISYSDRIELTWPSAGTGLSYSVYRGTNPSNLSMISGSVSSLKYVDRNISLNTDYYYSVHAANNTAWTGSNVVSGRASVTLYTLSNTASAGGSVSQSPYGSSFRSGGAVTLSAANELGYHFSKWQLNIAGTASESTQNPLLLNLSGNTTAHAVFEVDTSAPTNTTPTVDLKVNGSDGPTNVPTRSFNVSWTSTNVSNCSISDAYEDFSVANIGVQKVMMASGVTSGTVGITCSGPNGEASDEVRVTIGATSQAPNTNQTSWLANVFEAVRGWWGK